MKANRWSALTWAGLTLLWAVPAAHPLLLPAIGAPSHLLWWVHVLPVALLTFHYGRAVGLGAVSLSAALVALGELAFGAGYGRPAATETVLALTVAVTATNILVAWFALHARGVGARYRLLLDSVPAGVLRVDSAGRILAANVEARKLLAEGGELAGRALDDVADLPGEGSLDGLSGQGGWTGTVEVPRGGAPVPLPVFLLAVPDADDGSHQLVVVDRSLEVAQEQELERQAKLASLGEALAGVAHELKNPLTSVVAMAQLGSAGVESGDPAEAFQVIEEEAERMRALIGELLGFSRVPSNDSRAFLDRVVERLVRVRRMALPGAVELTLRPAWTGAVRGSAAKIEQILLNLVANATWEVERAGGGRIEIRLFRDGDDAVVEVADEGSGIPEEVLPRIFEPFVTTKPEGEGTGLGLAISRRLARSWGGDLEARNREDGGAVFSLRLPVAGEAGPVEEPPVAAAAVAAP